MENIQISLKEIKEYGGYLKEVIDLYTTFINSIDFKTSSLDNDDVETIMIMLKENQLNSVSLLNKMIKLANTHSIEFKFEDMKNNEVVRMLKIKNILND